jgi:hypothetical protein
MQTLFGHMVSFCGNKPYWTLPIGPSVWIDER